MIVKEVEGLKNELQATLKDLNMAQGSVCDQIAAITAEFAKSLKGLEQKELRKRKKQISDTVKRLQSEIQGVERVIAMLEKKDQRPNVTEMPITQQNVTKLKVARG